MTSSYTMEAETTQNPPNFFTRDGQTAPRPSETFLQAVITPPSHSTPAIHTQSAFAGMSIDSNAANQWRISMADALGSDMSSHNTSSAHRSRSSAVQESLSPAQRRLVEQIEDFLNTYGYVGGGRPTAEDTLHVLRELYEGAPRGRVADDVMERLHENHDMGLNELESLMNRANMIFGPTQPRQPPSPITPSLLQSFSAMGAASPAFNRPPGTIIPYPASRPLVPASIPQPSRAWNSAASTLRVGSHRFSDVGPAITNVEARSTAPRFSTDGYDHFRQEGVMPTIIERPESVPNQEAAPRVLEERQGTYEAEGFPQHSTGEVYTTPYLVQPTSIPLPHSPLEYWDEPEQPVPQHAQAPSSNWDSPERRTPQYLRSPISEHQQPTFRRDTPPHIRPPTAPPGYGIREMWGHLPRHRLATSPRPHVPTPVSARPLPTPPGSNTQRDIFIPPPFPPGYGPTPQAAFIINQTTSLTGHHQPTTAPSQQPPGEIPRISVIRR